MRLRALGGQPAPPDLASDLRRLERFPREALAKIWQALGPCLAEKVTPETERTLDVFQAAYGIAEDDLGRAIKACRFLLQAAAKHDVPPAELAGDLGRLCPEAPWIAEVLVPGYEPYRAEVRLGIRRAAIADHGKLLVDARWRLDTIEASQHGAGLRTPVVVLTFAYREGQETKRITLQALPDMIGQLKGLFEQIIP